MFCPIHERRHRCGSNDASDHVMVTAVQSPLPWFWGRSLNRKLPQGASKSLQGASTSCCWPRPLLHGASRCPDILNVPQLPACSNAFSWTQTVLARTATDAGPCVPPAQRRIAAKCAPVLVARPVPGTFGGQTLLFMYFLFLFLFLFLFRCRRCGMTW